MFFLMIKVLYAYGKVFDELKNNNEQTAAVISHTEAAST